MLKFSQVGLHGVLGDVVWGICTWKFANHLVELNPDDMTAGYASKGLGIVKYKAHAIGRGRYGGAAIP